MKLMRQMTLVGWGVCLEMLRRRDLHVALLLMAMFIVGTLAARTVGIERPAVGTFLLNLGLSLAYYCAHVLTLILAAGQLPNEIERRTLYPLLAKPVARSTVLMGKWAACALAGSFVFLLLAGSAWLATPKLEPYDGSLLGQLLGLAACSIALLAALAMLFSLVWTRGVTLVLLGLLVAAGGKMVSTLPRFFPDPVEAAVRWGLLYLPDFSLLDLITRYTDGMEALSAGQWIGLVVYSSIFMAAALALAVRLFDRRSL